MDIKLDISTILQSLRYHMYHKEMLHGNLLLA